MEKLTQKLLLIPQAKAKALENMMQQRSPQLTKEIKIISILSTYNSRLALSLKAPGFSICTEKDLNKLLHVYGNINIKFWKISPNG